MQWSANQDAVAMLIDANTIIGRGFPTEEGRKLADHLLHDKDIDWSDLTVDLRGCPSGLLISAFFNAFLMQVHESQSDLLDEARNINWRLDFDFQQHNVGQWMREFQPPSRC